MKLKVYVNGISLSEEEHDAFAQDVKQAIVDNPWIPVKADDVMVVSPDKKDERAERGVGSIVVKGFHILKKPSLHRNLLANALHIMFIRKWEIGRSLLVENGLDVDVMGFPGKDGHSLLSISR